MIFEFLLYIGPYVFLHKTKKTQALWAPRIKQKTIFIFYRAMFD